MDWQLDPAEARVLGSLMEKEVATPDYYPLSLNALVNACNQKSNRDPVVNYDEDTVEIALEGLRAKGLALRISGESRVPKHAQRFTEKFNLGRREAAIVCVMLLRGAQTMGELRTRTERLYPFASSDELHETMSELTARELMVRQERRPGQKEERYAQLLGGDSPAIAPAPAPDSLEARVARLEEQITELLDALDAR